MHTRSLAALVAVLITTLGSPASAEDEIILWLPEPDPEPKLELSYEDFKLQELERKAKRSRNALIGTSVAAAAGLALALPAAATQCNSVQVDGESSYECSRTGDALIRAGSPLILGGLTGALVSGIILGVRKGKIRRSNDSVAASSSARERAVQWDERRSRLVF